MEVKKYNLTDYMEMSRSLSNIREVKALRAVNNKKQEQLSEWVS